jgi:LytS/YehU family sensor histidine kinase
LIWDIQQEAGLKGKVPSLALQLLAENAVKHNVVSISKPLTIQVVAGKGIVRVINNFQKKNVTEPSTEIGLNNIVQRYLLSGYSLPEIIQSEQSFEVVLPLISV